MQPDSCLHTYIHRFTYIIWNKRASVSFAHLKSVQEVRLTTQTQTKKGTSRSADTCRYRLLLHILAPVGQATRPGRCGPIPQGVSSPQAEGPAPPPAGAPGAPSRSSGPGPPASRRGSTPQRPCTTPRAGRATALVSQPLPILASLAPAVPPQRTSPFVVLTCSTTPGHASERAALKGTGRGSRCKLGPEVVGRHCSPL